MYRLRIGKGVKRHVDNLPGHIRQRVRRLITSLAGDPRPLEANELRDFPGRFRIVVDGWRVIYRLDQEQQEVAILAVRRKTGPETYEDIE